MGRKKGCQHVLFALWAHPNNTVHLRLHRNTATLAHLHHAWHFEPLELCQFVCARGGGHLLNQRDRHDGHGEDDGHCVRCFY